MAKRVQSPSSINTFKQCPRRYYYQYIKKLPTYPNIHLVRGNIVHSALEKFFNLNPKTIDPLNHKKEITDYLSNLFEACWRKKKKKLSKVTKSKDQENEFYTDSRMMLGNWLNSFFIKLNEKMLTLPFDQAFNELAPVGLEEKYESKTHSVRGFVDVIEESDNKIKLVDYKTGKPKEFISPEYRLQLAIYALMFKEKHNKLPDKVSIWFLKNSEVTLDVTEELVKEALFEIEQIHFATESDQIKDYKCNITPLCKYSTGQCDFYDFCIKERHL